MSFWSRARDRLAALVSREQPVTSRVVYLGTTPAGEVITPDTALKQATVWACVTYLSRTVAQLPWRTLRELPNGGTEPVRAHAVHRLLSVRPNPEMTPFTFKETLIGYAASRGNGVAELVTNARGEVVEAWPIHPSRLSFKRDAVTGELLYEVSGALGEKSVLRGTQVLHVKGFGDGAVGLDVIAYAAETIGWARATEVFGASYIGQGMHPSGMLTVKGKLSPAGHDALQKAFDERNGGSRRAGKTIIVDNEGEYSRFSPDPAVAQLVETRQTQVEEICRWFGVPPHKVMHLLRSTFSNIEHQSIEVVVDSITPWCLRMEQEADYKLFGQNRAGLFTKLDLKGLLRGDYKSRQEGLQIMRRNGVISADEWRALEDMNPLPAGAGGDTYIVEGNMTKLESVGETPDPAPASPDPSTNPDDEADADLVTQARRQRAIAERSLH